ncbi:hypothetical protein BS47DRAFT_1367198 [Hydnum rufescens UP504]|uniref:Uncharacterized protein n=1 Tax=Hydnum rufescens UP504 TaxID=1448309 RepID=A0A9P6AKV7_9AGAM|nr:hypothetical protein BS47DRAFT_1367198 [Hydnum rufescens UP504]
MPKEQQQLLFGVACVILSPSAKPQSNYAPRVKYGGARSHPRPQPSRILNPYNDESSTAPHPLRFFLPPQNPIQRMHRQCTTKYRSAQPPKTPTLKCPQPIQRQNEYGATHPPKWVFSLRETPIQRIRGQGLGEIWACAQPPKTLTLDYSQPIQRGGLKYRATHPPKWVLSPSAQPHLKNATQDPNPEYQ